MSSDNLRVAMIIQAYHPYIGGAERQLGTIAPLLKERGVDVHILTRRYPGFKPFEVVDGVPVHRLPVPGPMPVASLIFSLAGIALLGRLKPDVIHAHELLSPTTTGVGAKLLYGTPLVAKVLGGGTMGDISKLRRNPLSALRVRTILKMVDRFITISREIGSELSGAGIRPDKLVFIPNGVDTIRFQPAGQQDKKNLRRELGLPDGLICIYTGRLDEEKNVAWLVSAWPSIRAKRPEAELLMIGAGAEEGAIRKTAGAGVLIAGKKEDVAPFLRSADLFILPSIREGLSNALLEAMACGLPSVVTGVGGNLELVRGGHNGLLVPPGDQGALESAVTSLLGDESCRKSMGMESRRIVLEKYQIEKTVDRLLALYQEVRRC